MTWQVIRGSLSLILLPISAAAVRVPRSQGPSESAVQIYKLFKSSVNNNNKYRPEFNLMFTIHLSLALVFHSGKTVSLPGSRGATCLSRWVPL